MAKKAAKSKIEKAKGKNAKKAGLKKAPVTKAKKAKAIKKKSGTPAQKTASHPLMNVRQRMDRLFDDFELGLSAFPFGFGRHAFEVRPFSRQGLGSDSLVPNMDMSEADDAYTLTAEMPGLTEKDVEVTLTDDMLTVSGERKDEQKQDEDNYHFTERRQGSFNRSFRLPSTVEGEKISASLKDGVLTVSMPKRKDATASVKKIGITSG